VRRLRVALTGNPDPQLEVQTSSASIQRLFSARALRGSSGIGRIRAFMSKGTHKAKTRRHT